MESTCMSVVRLSRSASNKRRFVIQAVKCPPYLSAPTLRGSNQVLSGFRLSTHGFATLAPTHGSGSGGSSEPFVVENESADFRAKLEKYSRFQPCPVSIAHFIEFGNNASLETSFLFLRREVPVRLANIMKELQLMPSELTETRGCSLVTQQYAQSFKEMTSYETVVSKDRSVLQDFTASLLTIRERHADTVISMAEAVMELKEIYRKKFGKVGDGAYIRPKSEKNIQYFLDRLYTSRISTRMLINQHTLLFDDNGERIRKVDGQGMSMVGTIDQDCEITPVVERAYEGARFLCEQYYLSAPPLEVICRDCSKKSGKINDNDKISFTYVPSHLYHILFELFKNAMRATIEHVGEDAVAFPPVKVLVVKGKEDVTIKVSDRGGGIPRSLRQHIFDYLYTTAPSPIVTNSGEVPELTALPGGENNAGVPMAGLGYGLPLSRLYARYFAGDLQLYSTEGWGTDAIIYLHALAGEAKERLPVYHETASKKIYEAQLTAPDWTYPASNLSATGHNKEL